MLWVVQPTGLQMKVEYENPADTFLFSAEAVSQILKFCLKRKEIVAWGEGEAAIAYKGADVFLKEAAHNLWNLFCS